MATMVAQPRAFAVLFKDLERWSVSSYFRINWKWPGNVIQPLAVALERKNIVVDRRKVPLSDLRLVTLHFDGKMEPRDMAGISSFKGKLLVAEAGQVIYSKIDVRNGAIGVVPPHMPTVAVSSEYPVYHVRPLIALPEYVRLLFRTSAFRQQINSMISGASGRKRVQPTDIEQVKVPLPPLPLQEAIVKHWRKSQADIATSREATAKLEAELPLAIYKALGTPRPKMEEPMPKVLALWWKELERWNFNYLSRARQGLLGFTKSRFSIQPLSQYILETMNGYCIKPVQTPTPHKMLKLNALTPGGVDFKETKFVKITDRIASRFQLRKDDLLICRSVGSYEHVAKCALVEGDRPDTVFPDIIIRARFDKGILPEFVREVIQTPLGRSYFQSNARTAVGMWKIGAEDIRKFPIPVPSLEIQKEIVDMVKDQRNRIAEERKVMEARQNHAVRDVEEMILGTKSFS